MNSARCFVLLALTALLASCAVVVPTMQVAGAIKTSYDIHEVARPEDRVDFGKPLPGDVAVEADLRERLAAAGDFLSVNPYVFDHHVYLVGLFRDKAEADTALDVVRGTDGVCRITGIFYLKNARVPFDPHSDMGTALALRNSLLESGALKTATLRINVVQKRAVILGRVGSAEEKAGIIEVARNTEGISGLDDYLEVSLTRPDIAVPPVRQPLQAQPRPTLQAQNL